MPLCVAGSLRELILENNELYNEESIATLTPSAQRSYLVTNKAFQDSNFVRSGACEKCRYRSLCPGVWRSYFEVYGAGELKAIK
jgi:MoaA/NifB/PqqE/SkfB family radical SAM enzyme